MNKYIVVAGIILAGGFSVPAYAEKAKAPPVESKPAKLTKLEGIKHPKRTAEELAIPVTVSRTPLPKDSPKAGKVSDLSRP